MLRKGLAALLVLGSLASMTGCWDHIEISDTLFVAGIGLDLNESGPGYRAVVEIVDVQSEGEKDLASKIVEGTGDTLYSAVQNSMAATGGTMFINHCKVIVIGEAMARQGVNEVVDMVLRSPNLRKTVQVMIAREATAKSVLTKKTIKNEIISFELGKMLTSNTNVINNTVETNMYLLHEAFISNCPSSLAPTISTRDNGGEDVLYIEGAAVFWGERLQGYLSGDQCKLYNLITNKTKNASIIVTDNALSENPIQVAISQCAIRLTPQIQGDSLSILVGLEAKATLQGAALLKQDVDDESTVKQLENSLERKLESDIKELIVELQREYGADIFDFGKEFEDHFRREWQGLKTDWQSHFKELEVAITADMEVSGSGLIGNYASMGSEANALP